MGVEKVISELPHEYEAKFIHVDPALISGSIIASGGSLVQERTLLRRCTFDIPGSPRGTYLRVRDEGFGVVTMTYKQFTSPTIDGMREINLGVDNFEDACILLETLGLKKATNEENYRTTYKSADEKTTYTIDEWPGIPPFIEVESLTVHQVLNASKILGLNCKDAVYGDVGEVYKRWGLDISSSHEITFLHPPNKRTESSEIYAIVGDREETPFQTFLSHTNEKQQSAQMSAIVIRELLKPNTRLIDIGAGDGSYLQRIMAIIDSGLRIHYTLLEPSLDVLPSLHAHAGELERNDNTVEILSIPLQRFDPQKHEKYDIALASHLYFMHRDDYRGYFEQMLSLLTDDGVLVFIQREKDDIFHFKQHFRTKLLGEGYKPKTVDESIAVFKEISDSGEHLHISRLSSDGILDFPIESSAADTRAIVEFLLDTSWANIPTVIQEEIMEYIKDHNGRLETRDGILVIRKTA